MTATIDDNTSPHCAPLACCSSHHLSVRKMKAGAFHFVASEQERIRGLWLDEHKGLGACAESVTKRAPIVFVHPHPETQRQMSQIDSDYKNTIIHPP